MRLVALVLSLNERGIAARIPDHLAVSRRAEHLFGTAAKPALLARVSTSTSGVAQQQWPTHLAPEVLGRLGAPAEAARGMRARRALGALSACVLGVIVRSLGVNIPCLGVNGVLPRHAEPGVDAPGSVWVAGMLVAAFLGSRRVNTENSRIWTVWRCNASAIGSV